MLTDRKDVIIGMNHLLSKVRRELSGVYINFCNDAHFSYKLAFIRLGEYFTGRCHLFGLNRMFCKKRFQEIKKYLSNLLTNVFQKYEGQSTNMGGCKSNANSPVFVMWWQGEENAPAIVKKCIASIRLHAGTHPVKIIEQRNIDEYLDIPDYIREKVLDGRMCLANFSDYVRVSLLNQYGGLWLDATIFVAYDLPEEYFTMPIYTCNSVRTGMSAYVSAGRWATFCLGCWKGNLYTRYIKDCFESYWKVSDSSIDYLIYDFLTDKAYSDLAAIKEAIEAIPLNNQRRNNLAAAMVNGLPAKEYHNIVQPDTVLYKLSWREVYPLVADHGEETIYHSFLENIFD